MTACDLENSFPSVLKRQSTLQAIMLLDSYANITMIVNTCIFPEVGELERFQIVKVTFSVTQGHWHWSHSIDHIRLSIIHPLQLSLYMHRFRDIISYFLNI